MALKAKNPYDLFVPINLFTGHSLMNKLKRFFVSVSDFIGVADVDAGRIALQMIIVAVGVNKIGVGASLARLFL